MLAGTGPAGNRCEFSLEALRAGDTIGERKGGENCKQRLSSLILFLGESFVCGFGVAADHLDGHEAGGWILPIHSLSFGLGSVEQLPW